MSELTTITFGRDKSNPNDREITVTKVEDGIWIHIDGYKTMVSGSEDDPVANAVIFVDTLYKGAKVHIWSHPDIEDPTHVIELKEKSNEEGA